MVSLHGKALYDQMRSSPSYTPVIQTAVRDYGFRDHEAAENSMDAFLQWFSLIPVVEHDKGYVMLSSDVDKIFHAFILNTSCYREFCRKNLGRFVDHNPLDQPDDSMPLNDYVDYTVQLLRGEFGAQLHPELQEWERQASDGSYHISCLGECDNEDDLVTMMETGMARTPTGAPILG